MAKCITFQRVSFTHCKSMINPQITECTKKVIRPSTASNFIEITSPISTDRLIYTSKAVARNYRTNCKAGPHTNSSVQSQCSSTDVELQGLASTRSLIASLMVGRADGSLVVQRAAIFNTFIIFSFIRWDTTTH